MPQIKIFKSFSASEIREPERALRLAAGAGFDGVEFCYDFHDPHRFLRMHLKKIRGLAQRLGLDVAVHMLWMWQMRGVGGKISKIVQFSIGDPIRARASEAFLKKTLAVAETLGAVYVNAHILGPEPDTEYWRKLLAHKITRAGAKFFTEEKIRAAAFKRAAAIAKKSAVPLAVENHPAICHNSLPSDFFDVSRELCVTLDTGHPYAVLQEALEREFWGQTFWFAKIDQIKRELGVDLYGLHRAVAQKSHGPQENLCGAPTPSRSRTGRARRVDRPQADKQKRRNRCAPPRQKTREAARPALHSLGEL